MPKNKDPAVLMYTADFLVGTMLMTDEQVGKYVRALFLQHQQGHLTKGEMMNICKTYDSVIFSKFSVDNDGLYFNDRMESEKQKRSQYSESRRKNRKKSEDMLIICESYDSHMVNENENEDIVLSSLKERSFIPPTVAEVQAYCDERKNNIDAEGFVDHYTTQGWVKGNGISMVEWKSSVREWEKRDRKRREPEKAEEATKAAKRKMEEEERQNNIKLMNQEPDPSANEMIKKAMDRLKLPQ